MADIKKRPLYDILNGIRYPAMFSAQLFKESLEYQHQSDDIIICTYPKCGTTWMQAIVIHILRFGRELETPYSFYEISPFIDRLGNQGIYNMPRPGAMKTHIPYSQLVKSSKAKYIFVIRDPKDCCISLYHHTKGIPGFAYWDGEFDQFFELFMAGEVEYNDYFDHLMAWYPHRNDANVFYTSYESMKTDIRNVVIKIAKFLGDEYAEAIENDNKVLNNIIHYTEFEYMKKNYKSTKYSGDDQNKCMLEDPSVYDGIKYVINFTASLNLPKDLPRHEHIRKGETGDWKNYFDSDQLERLNLKLLDKAKGTEILDWYRIC